MFALRKKKRKWEIQERERRKRKRKREQTEYKKSPALEIYLPENYNIGWWAKVAGVVYNFGSDGCRPLI